MKARQVKIKVTRQKGRVGEWIGWRRLSRGFCVSSEDAQILRLGSQPWQGQDPADSTVLLLCSYSNVFHSTEQKLHCYVGTFHEPLVFYLKLKPKWLLLSAWVAGHSLQVPEWKQGRPALSHFQVPMNSTASQRAKNWLGLWGFRRPFSRRWQGVGESTPSADRLAETAWDLVHQACLFHPPS